MRTLSCDDATVADAVTVLPFNPNVMLLELLNTIAERLLLVVPALRLIADTSPAVDGTV